MDNHFSIGNNRILVAGSISIVDAGNYYSGSTIEAALQEIGAGGIGGSGTVTSVSVVSANGFAGTVATATITPAITISTTVNGILKGNGTSLAAAVAGVDYVSSAGGSANSVQYNNAGAFGGFGSYSSGTTTLTMTDHILMRDNFNITFGTSNDSLIAWNTAQTVDALYVGTATAQNTVVFAEIADYLFDFAHAAQTNPTIFVHSAVQSTTQWLSLAHNQTNGVIEVGGTGALDIKSGGFDALTISAETFGSAFLTRVTPLARTGVDQRGADLFIMGGNGTGNQGSGGISFLTAQAGASGSTPGTYTTGLYLNPDGSVVLIIPDNASYAVQNTISGAYPGIDQDINCTGAGALDRIGDYTDMSGSTTSGLTAAKYILNRTGGTGGTYTTSGANSYTLATGNVGGYFLSTGSVTGHRAGVVGIATGGAVDYGGFFSATHPKASATRVGVFGNGYNSNATAPIFFGGFFTIYTGSAAPIFGTSAALVADNNTFTGTDIFDARSNNVSAFKLSGFGNVTHTQVAQAGGAVAWSITPGAHTAMTAEKIDISLAAHTVTLTDTTTIALARSVVFGATTFNGVAAGGTETVTTAINFEVGLPVQGTNLTITNAPIAARFLGNTVIGNILTPAAGPTNTLFVASGTAPTSTVADSVAFYSSDNSAGNTIPSFYCEGTEVIATGQADSASSVRVKMRINGTVVTLLAI